MTTANDLSLQLKENESRILKATRLVEGERLIGYSVRITGER